ncbi:hypothetical protein ASG39_00060 [Rhizobium sp. Leaf371]|uniref:hypothetical protein n=1 Tax=Rhizobium sp. Leaf371 TaxID=1736355 RepID=UPI000715F7A6|nr:hypothetical protein [Rhizobium sp. Leaf371]KQS72228.1 hypothetical protein ASG39_00060 [Rhizobium sp. Leaf371]
MERSISRMELYMSKMLLLVPAMLCLSYAGAASAAPACKTSFRNDSLGDKEAVIKCSHDGSAKPSYMCGFTWELENVKGGKRTLTGNFTVIKNEKDVEKYTDNRVGDERIEREVSPAKISCK